MEAGEGGRGSPLQARGVASWRQPKSLAPGLLQCAHALPGAPGAVSAPPNLGDLVDTRPRACPHTRRPQGSRRKKSGGGERILPVGRGRGWLPRPSPPDFDREEPPGSRP